MPLLNQILHTVILIDTMTEYGKIKTTPIILNEKGRKLWKNIPVWNRQSMTHRLPS